MPDISGTGKWADTVQLRYGSGPAKVYWASAANYALWGKVNALCYAEFYYKAYAIDQGLYAAAHWSLGTALAKVSLHKWQPFAGGLWNPLGYLGDQEKEAQLFTRYGFRGDSFEDAALKSGYSGNEEWLPDSNKRYDKASPYNWDGLRTGVGHYNF